MKIAVALMLASSVLLPFGGGAHRRTEEGNRHYTEGDYPEALRSYTEAQIKSPEAAELYYDLGNVFFRQNDFERASEAYTRALLMAADELEGAAIVGCRRTLVRSAVQTRERDPHALAGDARFANGVFP